MPQPAMTPRSGHGVGSAEPEPAWRSRTDQDEPEMQHDHPASGRPEDRDPSIGHGDRAGTGGRDAVVRAATVVVVAAYAWWAVALPPFSRAATGAVVLAGATAAVVGARGRRPLTPPVQVTGLAGWAALAITAGAWQLAAYVQHPRVDHPTLSSLTNSLLDSQPTRATAFVLWIAATVALARR
jgi:hypothetical protein